MKRQGVSRLTEDPPELAKISARFRWLTWWTEREGELLQRVHVASHGPPALPAFNGVGSFRGDKVAAGGFQGLPLIKGALSEPSSRRLLSSPWSKMGHTSISVPIPGGMAYADWIHPLRVHPRAVGLSRPITEGPLGVKWSFLVKYSRQKVYAPVHRLERKQMKSLLKTI